MMITVVLVHLMMLVAAMSESIDTSVASSVIAAGMDNGNQESDDEARQDQFTTLPQAATIGAQDDGSIDDLARNVVEMAVPERAVREFSSPLGRNNLVLVLVPPRRRSLPSRSRAANNSTTSLTSSIGSGERSK